MIQTPWVRHGAADSLRQLARRDDLLNQGLDLLTIHRHGNFFHSNHEARDMLTAQPFANGIFQLDCELIGERLAGLHDDKQKD